jgi:hypothetical protein
LLDTGSSSSSSVIISKGIDGKVGNGWDSEVIWKSKNVELLLMDGICGEQVVGISVYSSSCHLWL